MLGKFFSIFKVRQNLFSAAELDRSSSEDPDDSLTNHELFLKLLDIFKKPNVIEVYLNSFGCLTCLTNLGHIEKSSVNYTADALMNLVWCLSWASKTRLDPYRPYGGGVVPTFNLRWHVVLPPLSPDGPHVVFRKQQLSEASLGDFVLENFSRTDLLGWLQEGASVVFYGATGSGKTTALFASLSYFFEGVRLGIVESIAELPLISSSWFRLVEVPSDVAGKGGVSLNRLKCEILRLSPQKIVIGEVRDSEAQLWAELSRTGHGGIMTTLHAGTHEDAYRRIFNLLGSNKDQLPGIIGIQVSRDTHGQRHCKAAKLN
jgi:pilus assembly protein CpaF